MRAFRKIPSAVSRVLPASAVAAVVAAALALGLPLEAAHAQPGAGAAPPPPSVAVQAVVKRPVTASASFSGRVEAVDRVELRARIEGFLEARSFDEGAVVAKGDLLFAVEKAPYVAAVQDAQGAVLRAQSARTRAELELARLNQLTERQVASQARLDDAVANLAQAKGDVMRAEAALDKAKLNLGYTEIRAPIGGKIGKAAFSVGAFINPQSPALATVVSQDPIAVAFPVSQRDLLEVRRQAAAEGKAATEVVVKLRLADGSLYGPVGHVNFVDVQTDPATDSVTVRARIANPEGILVDRQLVSVVVEAAKPVETVVVPQRAVQVDQAGRYVFIVDQQNHAQMRRITVESETGNLFVVGEGLKEGERVIVDGIQKVRPGVVVQPDPAPAPLPGSISGVKG